MTRAILLLVVCASLAPLAGCAGDPALPRESLRRVPVACVDERPRRPELRSEADLLAMDRFRRTIASWADRRKLEAYARELEAIVEGCAKVPSAE